MLNIMLLSTIVIECHDKNLLIFFFHNNMIIYKNINVWLLLLLLLLLHLRTVRNIWIFTSPLVTWLTTFIITFSCYLFVLRLVSIYPEGNKTTPKIISTLDTGDWFWNEMCVLISILPSLVKTFKSSTYKLYTYNI